jgi:hypothetical protein
MEQFLDKLAKYLADDPHSAGTAIVTWILGDFGMSSPTALPFGYITPFNDTVKARTGGPHGVDDDTYTIPMFVVDDMQHFGDPTQVAGQSYFEQPGYRKLLQYAQNVRAALRANITLDGLIATSAVLEQRFLPVVIDDKPWRAVRITVQAQQRRQR